MKDSTGYKHLYCVLIHVKRTCHLPIHFSKYFHRSLQSTSLVEKIRHNFDLLKKQKILLLLTRFLKPLTFREIALHFALCDPNLTL